MIEQLKNGVSALRVPLYDLVSNWAYMVMAALAWNVKSWLALMMHLKRDRGEYILWTASSARSGNPRDFAVAPLQSCPTAGTRFYYD